MNRQIIFRGKRTGSGDWVEGSLLVYADGVCFICSQDVYPDVMNKYEVDHATVGQFTGLVDKNGVRIFEGDCLGHPHNVVEYIDGSFCVAGDRPLYMMAKHCSVVCAIHDTPELLQG